MDRTGSLSPPLNRSFRSKRALRVYDSGPDECIKCKKLEESQYNLSVLEVKMRRTTKHDKFHMSHTTPSTATSPSALAFPKRSYSIETETPTNARALARKPMTPYISSADTLSTGSNGFGRPKKPAMANDRLPNGKKWTEYHANGNASHDDLLNGNVSEGPLSDASYSVEISESHFQMTTTAESTGASDQASMATASDSSRTQSTEVEKLMADGKSPIQWCDAKSDTNNNESIKAAMDASVCLDKNRNVSGVYSNGVHEVYYLNAHDADSANESIVRIKSPESLDQNAIDSIISQILVDSLKNILGGQGKAGQTESDPHAALPTNAAPSMSGGSDANALSASPSAAIADRANSVGSDDTSKSSLSSLNNSTVSVIGGSSYPGAGGEMVVHRVQEVPRTDSLEVQPSSPSSTSHSQDTTLERLDDDDLDSLVDSLDDPAAMAEPAELDVTVVKQKPAQERSFFVPLPSKGNVFFVPLEPKGEAAADVSDLLPEKLRKRLVKRQTKMTERKEAESKRRVDNIQKIIQEYDFKGDGRDNGLSYKVMPYKPLKPKISVERARIAAAKKTSSSRKQLRSEVGLLESYTIDAHGNLQWAEPGQNAKGAKPPPTYRHVIKKTVTTTTTTKPQLERSSDSSVSSKGSVERRTKAAPNQRRSRASITEPDKLQGSLKAALVQRPMMEQITPDPERGPRRMYQKTEIHEGAKRIEILEIVECINGTPDDYAQHLHRQHSAVRAPPAHEKYSKIPVPTSKMARLRDQRAAADFERRHSDDGLFDASDASTEMGANVPKSSAETSPEAINNAKRIRLASRRSNGIANGTPNGKRSAHNSAKYQQVFDAIPEEKLTSVSTDSAPEDTKSSSVQCDLPQADVNLTKTSADANANGAIERLRKANGKAAIECDPDKAAEVWYGCFGRAHDDSHPIIMEPGK